MKTLVTKRLCKITNILITWIIVMYCLILVVIFILKYDFRIIVNVMGTYKVVDKNELKLELK